MFSRRELLMAGAALSAIAGSGLSGRWSQAVAQQGLTEDGLLDFQSTGNVTILHVTDLHAQLVPVYFREPSINLGVGGVAGLPPHVTGADFLKLYNIEPGTPEAYAMTSDDYVALARSYGKMGGLDRIATIVKRVRAERGEKVLLLDGGDTWQGSYTSLQTKGQDMVDAMNALQPDAMTGHWEFTYGTERVKEIIDGLPFAFLGGNIFDTEWNEPAFEAYKMFEKGGAKIAVLGQAFPYTPIANPRWMFPNWSFGIREEEVAKNVAAARAEGADLVVLLSHNGFDVDRAMAARVPGIDIILAGHTHDALPEPVIVGQTLVIASGSHGKFLTRLDLDVQDGKLKSYRHRLIPVFTDVIAPDAEMTKLVEEIRAPHMAELSRELATAESLLYRRGNFNGTFDDLICQALLEVREADISLSPGFRWGTSVLPGQKITVEDVHNACSMTYPMPIAQTRPMLRTSAMSPTTCSTRIPTTSRAATWSASAAWPYDRPHGIMGSRISQMTMLKTGEAVDPAKTCAAGWA
jgi:sulfur-oxidizing protein SoxB